VQKLALSQRKVMNKAIEQWADKEVQSETLSSRYVFTDEQKDHE
jgi:hypothetical protein